MLKSLHHALIRNRAKLHSLPTCRYWIGLAETDEEHRQGLALAQGVGAEHSPGSPRFLPGTRVLIAKEGENMVGSITLTVDSGALLPIDRQAPLLLRGPRTRAYGEDTRVRGEHPAREPNAPRLAQVGEPALSARATGGGLRWLLQLAASRLAWKLGCTHLVTTVAIQSVTLHRATLGFEPLGRSDSANDRGTGDGGANDRRAMVMLVERHAQRAHLKRCGRHRASRRTIEDLVFGDIEIPNTDLDAAESARSMRAARSPRGTFRRLYMECKTPLATEAPFAPDWAPLKHIPLSGEWLN